SAARGVIVMRLNQGDGVVGIAVFREGLAEQRSVDENDEAGTDEETSAEAPDGEDPGTDGAA
ncbi:MAG: hypothetical protein ACC726_09125, partial [Chloroflexota bacterium]